MEYRRRVRKKAPIGVRRHKRRQQQGKSECGFDDPFDDITFPNGDPVFITRRDVRLLQPRAFINDAIIDFYMKCLSYKIKPEEQHRFHFFNSFFYQKLVDLDRDLSRDGEGDAFQRVRNWTRNVNVFEKDFIFIPMNFSQHWSLIVICHPGEVANLKDKGMDSSSRVPCILHMDSIRGTHGGIKNLFRSYLSEEWKERGHKQEEHILVKFSKLKFIPLQVPQQENLFDCGIFLLHYAELFLEQISYFGSTKSFDFLNEDWFLPAEVSLTKRGHIRKLIHKIVEDNALKNLPAVHNNNLPSGINEADGCAKSLQQNGATESSCVKFTSADFEIKRRVLASPRLMKVLSLTSCQQRKHLRKKPLLHQETQ